jgi:hypothetical protein
MDGMAEAAAESSGRLRTVPDGSGQPGTDGKDGGDQRLGRALDIAGVCAAVVLGVIIFDIMSGGKITRLLRGKRGGCEGCGDQDPSGDS